jgi:hypothetical protein
MTSCVRRLVLLVGIVVATAGCDGALADRGLTPPATPDDAQQAGNDGAGDMSPPADDPGSSRAQPALPEGWPDQVELGMSSGAGDAQAVVATAPFCFRYQYLAGGVNTGNGWATWNPDGGFVTDYIEESQDADTIPVFTHYMIFQSEPGNDLGEPEGVHANLTNRRTMAAYYRDLALFFQRAGAAGGTTVLHVEPDLWAFLQQQSSGDDAGSVGVQVGSTGVAGVEGLPDTAAGFATAIERLRDRYAPKVLLAYHLSTWATGVEILGGGLADDEVRALGERAADFYASLGTSFDIAFTDIADRDAAFKEEHYGDGGASWMDSADYRRSATYIAAFVDRAGIRAVLWQLPYGNTKMRAVDNTWGHYQDNKVETLLGQPDRAVLEAYTDAGVVAYLFGGGADGTTCACDARDDGVTDPAPINGNERPSLSADDDGGYFRARAAAYYEGPVPLAD